MSRDPLQQFADVIARLRVPVQIVGVMVTVLAFFIVRSMAPTNLAAQLAAGLVGVALVAFTHYFQFLQRLAPEERGSLARAGFASLALCLTASVASAGYFLSARAESSGGGGGAGPPAETKMMFSETNDDEIEIHLAAGTSEGSFAKGTVKVLKVWSLTPDETPSGAVTLPGTVSIELPADKNTPYTVESAFLPSKNGRVYLTLGPRPPSSVAKMTSKFDRTKMQKEIRLAFNKGAKDYVFLLEVTLAGDDSKPLATQQFLYMPEFKTRYGSVAAGENRNVLREVNGHKAIKSRKLAELLTANALTLEGKE